MSDFFEKFYALKSHVQKVYIYGAGLFGTNIYNEIVRHGSGVDGFVVTKKGEQQYVQGLNVYEISEVMNDEIGIVIGVNRRNEVSIREHLRKLSFPESKIINGNDLMDDEGTRGGYDDSPTIELTTKIGCTVNCKYCPQSKLIREYYREDKQRVGLLRKETLNKCLDHIPENTRIRFCGMAEPFLNPSCMELIRLVFQKRERQVDLFTTLEGLEESDVEELISYPFSWVNIHLPDVENYAKITTDDHYYRILSRIMDAKTDGKPFVNVVSAQARVEDRAREICGERFIIFDSLTDRAGNLEDQRLLHNKCKVGSISCSLCGNNLNNNVMLPDGSLVLCCMDYGMRHVLGNLCDSNYEEIMRGVEAQKIRNAMLKDTGEDVLCRHCSYASEIAV